jgi:LysM repeat protein
MSPLKPAYGSVLVTVIILALTLIAGNAWGGVQAAQVASPAQAPQAAAPLATPQPPTRNTIGAVSGTALPGDTIRVTQGQVVIGETVADAEGAWRVPITRSGSAITPYHVQILPSERRGTTVEVEGPVHILVSVVVGLSRVEVQVQVISPNGQIDIEVLAPVNPACENQAAGTQPTPEAAPQAVYHQVQAGETLASIAGRYRVTTGALMQANKLRNANLIYVGQRLVIPASQ